MMTFLHVTGTSHQPIKYYKLWVTISFTISWLNAPSMVISIVRRHPALLLGKQRFERADAWLISRARDLKFSLISETTNTILSGRGVSRIVVRDYDNLPGRRGEDLLERIFSKGGKVQNSCHFETTATDRRVTDWF